MPNWVQNTIKVKGPVKDVDRLLELVQGESDFDFNKIIPMPTSLNTVAGGRDQESVIYYLSDRLTRSDTAIVCDRKCQAIIKEMNMFSSVSSALNRLKMMIENQSEQDLNDLYETGKQYYENYVRYGHTSWYGWSIDNWGTKWNACEVDVKEYAEAKNTIEIAIYFQTAWSMPEPIFTKLAGMFPTLTFYGEWADEDIGNNCGFWGADSGNISFTDVEDVEFACNVWGYDPDEYLSDDEEDEEE